MVYKVVEDLITLNALHPPQASVVHTASSVEMGLLPLLRHDPYCICPIITDPGFLEWV